MNKKLLLIPATFLAASLILTGCTPTTPTPEPTSTSTPNPTETNEIDIEIPDDVTYEYGIFVHPFATLPADPNFAYPASLGAKTFAEDPTPRTNTLNNFNVSRDDGNDKVFDVVFNEVTSDVDTSAVNISKYLEANPTAELADIPAELVVNRYLQLVTVKVFKDDASGIFFVIADDLEESGSLRVGQAVPQAGVTPEDLIIPEEPAPL